MLRKAIIPSAMSLFFLLTMCGMVAPDFCMANPKPDVIKFAVFPYKSPKSVIEVFTPLVARLEKKLGQKVQLVSAPDGESFLAKGLVGEYDLALPSIGYAYRFMSAGYNTIARGVPSFKGGAIVRHDSEIKNIEQCRGKKIAAISEHSYGGYIFLKDLLTAKKIDPIKDMNVQFLNKVDTIVYGVLNKKYDVGLLRIDSLDTPDFAALKGQFRVVALSSEIPQFPFVVKKSMDQQTVAAIREVLTSLSPDRPEDRAILKSLQINKIIGATNRDYDPFYKVIKNNEYFKKH